MEKIEIILLNSNKRFEIIINLNESIIFDYLLEYLSNNYPLEHFCPCFQFIDYKKERYIKGNERVIDLIEICKNTFFIENPNKKCNCSKLLQIHYHKSKIEIIQYLNEVMENYNEALNTMGDEISQLKNDKKILEMSLNDPQLIDKIKELTDIGNDSKPRENITTVDPSNNQIIVNQSINKKNFVDFYDVIIDIKSIKDINKGWEIKMSDKGKQNYEKYKETKNLKIGIVGNSNKGKSFLLSKISKIDLPSGTSIRTEGLSIKYPELEMFQNRKLILLDSAGLETPVLRESKPSDNINKEEQKNNIIEEENNKNEKDNNRGEEFKEKSREKLITELFLQNYIINNSDILIIVVGILTYSEQKLINKIKKLQNEKKKDSNKTLFIIHNLITYTSIQQVEDYIKEYLLQSTTFDLEEGHNISTNIESENGKYFYEKKAESKIYHLIYANEGSEAGKFYNQSSLKFLENYFQDVTDLETFDVIKEIKYSFIDLSREIFEKMNKKLTINDFNNDSKCIKLNNHNNLTLKKCFIDELGFSNLQSNEFEPKYNYYKKDDKIIIKIESPGLNSITHSMHESVEYNKIIKIDGEKKKDKEEENNNNNIYNSREFGKYSIQFPIIYNDNYVLKNEDPNIEEKKGVITFEYQMEEKVKETTYVQSEEI